MKMICKDSRGNPVYPGDMIGWHDPKNGPSFDNVDDLDADQIKQIPVCGVVL